jgi:hypothetical protein
MKRAFEILFGLTVVLPLFGLLALWGWLEADRQMAEDYKGFRERS